MPNAFPALTSRWFRFMLLLQLGNALGVWSQVVAGQWVLVEGGSSALVVSLVPAAVSLPFVLLAVPMGSVVSHRRREHLMATAMTASALASGGVAVLLRLDGGGPVVLVASTAVVGVALVVIGISWQTMLPETVERTHISSATVLDGAIFNAARALGPVLAGVGLVAVGPQWVFTLNAALFGGAAVAVLVSGRRWPSQVGTREPLWRSMRSGLWFVRHSPWTRRILFRMAAFGIPAASLWALLPVVVHDRLQLTSVGLGVATGMLGLGAVVGTVVIAPLRDRLTVNVFVAGGSAVYGIALLVLASSTWPPLVIAAMVPAGMAWVGVQSTWMMLANQALPGWIRPRVIALMLCVFQGTQAIGAIAWGVLADWISPSGSLAVAAGCLALTVLGFRRRGLPPVDGLTPDPANRAGPALVDIEGPVQVEHSYVVAKENREAFVAAARDLRMSRLRLGAQAWVLLNDPASPELYVERFRLAVAADLAAHGGERLTVPEDRVRRRLEDLAEVVSAAQVLSVVDVGTNPRTTAARPWTTRTP
ncbi:MFS transporter [Aeromicrobium alkaliterrae]|uniref:MFS transporter n=1 Tax=Aeromicrobium alkaliterrae TaxID=302168 RepID=A0ABN2JF76_9ACTN